jgi:hypothetical protein
MVSLMILPEDVRIKSMTYHERSGNSLELHAGNVSPSDRITNPFLVEYYPDIVPSKVHASRLHFYHPLDSMSRRIPS